MTLNNYFEINKESDFYGNFYKLKSKI